MAGLENLGMICYSNAVLHALGNSKEVHDNLQPSHTLRHAYNSRYICNDVLNSICVCC